MPINRSILFFIFLSLAVRSVQAQAVLHEYNDSVVLSNGEVAVVLHPATGRIDYRLPNGIRLDNTVAFVRELHEGYVSSSGLGMHPYSTDRIADSMGSGLRINIKHMEEGKPLYLLQHITLYDSHPWIVADLQAGRLAGQGPLPETRQISPIAVLPSEKGYLFMPGEEPRILDEPFDNDDWVGVVERKWPDAKGIGYEFASVYDNTTMAGLVLGSLTHDFWKTGISYGTAAEKGVVDSFLVFGGAATPDVPNLPHAYGGQDGTHDHLPHGTMKSAVLYSPLVFLSGGKDLVRTFTDYGAANAIMNGRLSWKGYAPFYWNSFGVEGVLGYEKVMMPPGVGKISDLIHSLDQFNRYASPVLSIDSYDQSIYTTELLTSLGKYGKKQNQQMGFYFIPFATWTWKNGMDQARIPGTDYLLKDVILRDANNDPIAYKDGDWGAFPLDPTHPATRQTIINQLEKAKAIHASFIKIDFLSAGALESSTRYDPAVRTGMQAYNRGMKMLKQLIDSILGPDIFITQAISPMFPHQYAHTRFISTDVYSHLRDDQPGFPNWGSTEASLATGSHLGWVKGTLWPYTNMDVVVMKNFQKNPQLSEQEIKVRIYAMMVMGSILGDGSDLRQPLAAERAKKFLNHPAICAYFSNPAVFIPLRFADGDGLDQQMAFYLPAANATPPMLALFNFSGTATYPARFGRTRLGLQKDKKYILTDFMTDAVLGTIEKDQQEVLFTVGQKDAVLLKCITKE